MREEGKYQNRKRITKIFCFILVFTFLCVSAGLLGLLNSNQSPKAEINVAVGAPINSDSWTSNSSYYIQPTLQDTGQSNSESNPYIIDSAEKLAYLSKNYSWADEKYFLQTENIDLNAHYWVPINNVSSTISRNQRAYYYDGGEHTISNLYINTTEQTLTSTNYIGLFGYVYGSSSKQAYIKNVNITSGSVNGNRYVGAIVGSACYTDITNCSNQGVSVTGISDVGGIAGRNYDNSTISNCYNTGTVTGSGDYVGGIAGRNYDNSTISNCYNEGTVTGSSSYVGGIAGSNSSSTISNCYNTGDVTSTSTDIYSYVGGISGYGDNISLCFNTGNITSSGEYVGGISGSSGDISLCFNTGNITSSGGYVGGISGRNGTISVCYSTGSVSGTSNVGGIIGGSGTVYNSYYDNSKLSSSNSYGTPLTLEQMTVLQDGVAPEAMEGFYAHEWIFTAGETPKVNPYDYGTTEIPTLQNTGQSNSTSNPYLIDSEAKLAYLSENSSWAADKYFLQTTNLDFSNYDYFVPINIDGGERAYYYDGGEFTISNINIFSGRPYVGLFGYIKGSSSNRAYIKNVNITSGSVNGNRYVGAIVGYAYYTDITNCSNQGVSVTGSSDYAGGIAGCCYNGIIRSCYNTVDVTSTGTSSYSSVGGISGYGDNISLCFNTGNITSSSRYVGGITGRGSPIVCYNLGRVSGIGEYVGGVTGSGSSVYSYYDSNVVTTSNEYGTPLTLEQMTVSQDGVAPEAMQGFCDTEWIFTLSKTPKVNTYDYGATEIPSLQRSGSNSKSNPYVIDSEAKLAYLSENSVWAADKYFLQTKNLDFSGYEYFVPIGIDYIDQDLEYNYDGGNHTISNITIKTGRNYVGIFSYSYGGYINNLGIENGTIIGNDYVGGILGCADGSHSSSSSTVIAAKLSYCFNNANIYGNDYVGGIVGIFKYGAVTNSYNTGSVTGNDYVAGIVSGLAYSNVGTIIEDSYNEGTISGNNYVGGIMAEVTASSSITRAYNIGNISGSLRVGGITGYLEDGSIISCYNSSHVTGSSAGGIFSDNSSNTYFVNSYYNKELFTGSSKGIGLTLSEMTVTTNGVAPEKMKGLYVSEWNFITGELPKLKTEYVYGNTQMPSLQGSGSNSESNPYIIDNEAKLTYLSENSRWASGKYFLQTANLDFSSYEYFIPINNSDSNYAFYYDGGNHTISNIKIEISKNYVGLFGRIYGSSSKHAYVKNVHLVNSSVGGVNSVGSIVGNGQYIDIINCTNNGTKVVGGSGVAGIAGSLSNASVINCNNSADVFSTYYRSNVSASVAGLIGGSNAQTIIINSYNTGNVNAINVIVDIGGIAARNSGNIINCFNTGVVTGNGDVGGIVGENSGSISNCYNTGDVTSTSTRSSYYLGGIAGDNSGTISNCYNTGVVTGSNQHVGGIAGYNEESTISNCYNTGDVTSTSTRSSSYVGGIAGYNSSSTISNCYNTGDVTSTSTSSSSYTGGIVGYVRGYSSNKSLISSCFNAGAVSGNGYLGGVVGYIYNSGSSLAKYVSVSWCFYNEDTAGVTTAIGRGTGYQCYGLSTADMQGEEGVCKMNLSNSWWNFASGEYPTLKYVAQAQN